MTATINNKAITISAPKTVAGVAVVNGAAGMSGADYALIVRVGLSVLFIYLVYCKYGHHQHTRYRYRALFLRHFLAKSATPTKTTTTTTATTTITNGGAYDDWRDDQSHEIHHALVHCAEGFVLVRHCSMASVLPQLRKEVRSGGEKHDREFPDARHRDEGMMGLNARGRYAQRDNAVRPA